MKRFLVISLVATCLISCISGKVTIDEEFTRTYMPDQGGVTQADGSISFVLEDGSSIFMTGDCFTGDIVDGRRDLNDPMINNAFVHISKDGKYVRSIYRHSEDGSPLSLYTPKENNDSTIVWYWPGHSTEYKGIIYSFMTKFLKVGEGTWGFAFAGTDLLTIDPRTFEVITSREVFDKDCPIHWGHCVMQDGGYLYVYGTESTGNLQAGLRVLRIPLDDLEGWQNVETFDICQGVETSVSEQFSVFKDNDKYVLITQRRGGNDIHSEIADSPIGPWYNDKLLYKTTESESDSDLFTYNTMAHPQYIDKKGNLLICYNVNSNDITKVYVNPNAYRPVFLRVPMKMILRK